jgi:hypothetical protein
VAIESSSGRSIQEIGSPPSIETFRGDAMREQVIQIVEQYIDAVRRNDAAALPLHPDVVLA